MFYECGAEPQDARGVVGADLEGSPVFVLDRLLHHTAVTRMRLSPQRVRLIFIEKERDRYEYLLGELARRFGALDALPVHVVVRHGEAGEITRAVLDEIAAGVGRVTRSP